MGMRSTELAQQQREQIVALRAEVKQLRGKLGSLLHYLGHEPKTWKPRS